MHFRRLVSFLLGLWIGGSLFMAFVATQNFRSVDRLLGDAGARAEPLLRTLGQPEARMLFRHFVSEQNRFYFVTWEWAQLLIGALVLLLMTLGSREHKVTIGLAAAMVAIVLVFRFILTPQITELGRVLDFQSPDLPSDTRNRFRELHTAYSSAEVVKWILGLAVIGIMIVRRRRRPETPDDAAAIENSVRRVPRR
jgi:MFS superfamily sulfate permease-like transporter